MAATNLVVPQSAALLDLTVLNTDRATGWHIHLFSNNVTVSDTTTLAMLTEASYTGYAAQTLSTWTTPATVGGAASTTAALVTFPAPSGSSATIYGYYVTDGSGNLRWCQNDPNAPFTLNVGVTYPLTPAFTYQSQF
jgi:hypothetical protein